jgi:carbamoyl-phosphate synthase large subunit
VPFGSDEGYVARLISICEQESVDLLIPIFEEEQEAIASRRSAFGDISVAVSDIDSVKTCNDKLLTHAFLKRQGIPTPELFKSVVDASAPFIVKPRRGTGGQGAIVVNNGEEAKRLRLDEDAVIIQKYVTGREYSVDAYSTLEGNFVGAVPRLRIIIKGGLATQTVTINHPTLVQHASQIMSALPILGPANIQFIEDRVGDLHCIDINPRFGGAYITAIRAGLNAPLYLLDALAGNKTEYNGYESDLLMLRYWEEVFESGHLVGS